MLSFSKDRECSISKARQGFNFPKLQKALKSNCYISSLPFRLVTKDSPSCECTQHQISVLTNEPLFLSVILTNQAFDTTNCLTMWPRQHDSCVQFMDKKCSRFCCKLQTTFATLYMTFYAPSDNIQVFPFVHLSVHLTVCLRAQVL